jgi:hypothetical protein
MTSNQAEHVSGLISAANVNTEETRARFGGLAAEQLNWKPSADQWSVAQCMDHLVTTNGTYFPSFEKVLRAPNKTATRVIL